MSSVNGVFKDLEVFVQTKDDAIALLQSKLNKSLANATVPDVNSDPLIGFDKKKTDFTGRSILDNIPSTARRKLKINNPKE